MDSVTSDSNRTFGILLWDVVEAAKLKNDRKTMRAALWLIAGDMDEYLLLINEVDNPSDD